MKKGFTLAEVLITLGIICIVAAMTLPAVVQKKQKLETSARLKKFYSTMQQAIIYSETENGEMQTWTIETEGSNVDRAERYYHTYFDNNYFKIIKTGKQQVTGSSRVAFAITFADGSVLYLWNGSCLDLMFDVNGDKKPNKDGRDIFKFLHCKNRRLEPYHIEGGSVATREQALNVCKRYPTECMPLIMTYDNWEFKKDYPY